jgi:hypothetical protein
MIDLPTTATGASLQQEVQRREGCLGHRADGDRLRDANPRETALPPAQRRHRAALSRPWTTAIHAVLIPSSNGAATPEQGDR